MMFAGSHSVYFRSLDVLSGILLLILSGIPRSPGVELAYWTGDLADKTEYYTGRVIIIHSVL